MTFKVKVSFVFIQLLLSGTAILAVINHGLEARATLL